MIKLARTYHIGDSTLVLYVDDLLSSTLLREGVCLLTDDEFPEPFKVKKILSRKVEKRNDDKYGEFIRVKIDSI